MRSRSPKLALIALACVAVVVVACGGKSVDERCVDPGCPALAPFVRETCRCEPMPASDGGDVDADAAPPLDAGPTTIAASDYDRSCVTSDDCVAILEGSLCAVCGCPNAAIAKKDAAREEADAKRRAAACPPPTGGVMCGPCYAGAARCRSGQCVYELCMTGVCPPDDAGTDAAFDAR